MDNLIEFSRRRFYAIRVVEDDDGLLVLAGPYGWRHGDAFSAFADAQWLSRNWGLPVRSEVRA